MKVSDLKTNELEQACKNFQVKELYVFGSVVTGEISQDSDLDFLVVFNRSGFEGAFDQYMEFTKEKSYEEFQEDRMLQLAIEREFEIIGEALFRLEKADPNNLADRIPEYRKIIDFRNILAHGYDIIDVTAMWDFVQNRVPELLEKVQDY